MNGHFNLCHDTDIKKLYTEISSLNRIFHEKAASTGSRVSFLENPGSIKTIKQRGNAENKIKKKSAHLLSIMILLFFQRFLMNGHLNLCHDTDI